MPDDAPPAPSPGARQVPREVRLAAGVVAVEAAALLGLAVWVGLTPTFRDVNAGLTGLEAVFALVAALLCALLARGLYRARSWAFTPALLVAFFTGVLGLYQIRTVPALALALLVLAVALAALLLSPGGRAAFPRRD